MLISSTRKAKLELRKLNQPHWYEICNTDLEENNLEGSLMKKPKARVKVNAMKTLLSKELSCWKRNLSGKLATGNYGEPDDLHGAAHQNPSKPKIKSI